jgi:hypothetical protein
MTGALFKRKEFKLGVRSSLSGEHAMMFPSVWRIFFWLLVSSVLFSSRLAGCREDRDQLIACEAPRVKS